LNTYIKDKANNRNVAKLYILSDVKKLRKNNNIKYFTIIDIVLSGGFFVFLIIIKGNKIIIDRQKRVSRKLVSGILKKLGDLLYTFINSFKSRVNIRLVMLN
jgi:hypothetical protein